MTISSQTSKVTASGNDVATTFSFSPIVIFESGNLVVVVTDAAGTETTISEGTGSTNYSVSVSSYPGTGSITYPASGGTPLATGATITIKRVLTLEQSLDLDNQGGYFADLQETAFDKAIAVDIQQQEEIDRSFRFPIGYTGGISTESDTPAANKFLKVNAAGTALEWADTTTGVAVVSDDNSEDVSLSAAGPGVSPDVSRKDHVHLLPTVSVAKGGTGSTTASAARTALGVAIGSDVQAYDADTALRDVEAAWTAAQYFTPQTDDTSSLGAITFDFAGGNYIEFTLTENLTSITLSNVDAGKTCKIRLKQHASSAKTVTGWPATVIWQDADTDPVMNTTVGKYTMIVIEGGTTEHLGFYADAG